jgi:hypothetical protein
MSGRDKYSAPQTPGIYDSKLNYKPIEIFGSLPEEKRLI